MEGKWKEPRQVCHDKGFNVATKSLTSDIERVYRDIEFSLSNTRQHNSVARKKNFIATTNLCYWEKHCRNKEKSIAT